MEGGREGNTSDGVRVFWRAERSARICTNGSVGDRKFHGKIRIESKHTHTHTHT